MQEQDTTFEGVNPVAWVRCTREPENRDRDQEAIERLLEIARRYGFPMPSREVAPIIDQPFLAQLDIEIHAGPRDLIAPYLFVVTSSPSIAPCPVRPPLYDTMFALHNYGSGDRFTLFSPVPELLLSGREFWMQNRYLMRTEGGLTLGDATDLIEEQVALPFFLQEKFWHRS